MRVPVVAAAAVLLSACAVEPPGAYGIAVADPLAPVPPVAYVPVTAGTVDHQPVTPRPWGEVNDRVAPEDEQ